jgi:hypothetical protein
LQRKDRKRRGAALRTWSGKRGLPPPRGGRCAQRFKKVNFRYKKSRKTIALVEISDRLYITIFIEKSN